MKSIDVMVDGYAMRLHLSAVGGALPLVFINDNIESGDGVAALLDNLPLNVAVVDPGVWEDALTPWPEPGLSSKGPQFGGKGRDLIRAYWKKIIPKAEQMVVIKPCCRIISGYSLAGLWGVYAGWESGLFERVAVASASLWYEGFLDYLKTKEPASSLRRIHMALGRKEAKARNPRLARIGEATAEARTLMQQKGVTSNLVMTEGGHFTNAASRLADTIRAVVRE
ncbi:MAG: hypothetical protein Q4D07_05600 [Selenomonadaceae bacterium]|nr:hypothetical protein [Selenomonadaceae bacterium]